MDDLYRLVYTSRNLLPGIEAEMSAVIVEILKTSQDNNLRAGVTGALLFNKGAFAQVLEGPYRAIEETFERIQRDERHGDVTVLQCGHAAERCFGNWSMAFVGCSPHGRQQWNDLAEQSGFDVTRMDGDAVFGMLQGLVLEEEGMPPASIVTPEPDQATRRASGFDADEVWAELSRLRPDARPSSASSAGEAPPARAPTRTVEIEANGSAVAVLKASLADERQRTTGLRAEVDELRLALAMNEDALHDLRQDRDGWAERARLLALAVGEQVAALHGADRAGSPNRIVPGRGTPKVRSAA